MARRRRAAPPAAGCILPAADRRFTRRAPADAALRSGPAVLRAGRAVRCTSAVRAVRAISAHSTSNLVRVRDVRTASASRGHFGDGCCTAAHGGRPSRGAADRHAHFVRAAAGGNGALGTGGGAITSTVSPPAISRAPTAATGRDGGASNAGQTEPRWATRVTLRAAASGRRRSRTGWAFPCRSDAKRRSARRRSVHASTPHFRAGGGRASERRRTARTARRRRGRRRWRGTFGTPNRKRTACRRCRSSACSPRVPGRIPRRWIPWGRRPTWAARWRATGPTLRRRRGRWTDRVGRRRRSGALASGPAHQFPRASAPSTSTRCLACAQAERPCGVYALGAALHLVPGSVPGELGSPQQAMVAVLRDAA